MQIVINLADKTYKDIKEENGIYSTNDGLSTKITGKVVGAIQSGTPLPKGHGRLIDVDKLNTHFVGTELGTDLEVYLEPTVVNADTIVEADIIEADQDTFDTTHEDNICQSCIHKEVCKFNTVCRDNPNDICSAYEPENICYLCSKSNSCEVKDYPVSRCKQHYYSKKPRFNKIKEEIKNIKGKIIIEDYVEYGSNCPKYVPLEEVLQIIDKCELETVL